jgi:hypothetical protein
LVNCLGSESAYRDYQPRITGIVKLHDTRRTGLLYIRPYRIDTIHNTQGIVKISIMSSHRHGDMGGWNYVVKLEMVYSWQEHWMFSIYKDNVYNVIITREKSAISHRPYVLYKH